MVARLPEAGRRLQIEWLVWAETAPRTWYRTPIRQPNMGCRNARPIKGLGASTPPH